MIKTAFISVDLQYDFTRKGGSFHNSGRSPTFVREVLIPHFVRKEIGTAEIISDYRQPRPGDPRNMCHPGSWGYSSEIPDSIRKGSPWIKCMNSPIWVRKNIGDPKREPGIPYQDPGSFDKWLLSTLGGKKDVKRVILFGLTLDACILCTAQELTFRGYEVEVIYEGTDTRSGSKKEKEYQLSNPPVTFWLKRLDWSDLLGRMKE